MKSTYPKNYLQLKAAVKNGLKYPLVNRLAFYASNFAPAAPLNQAVALGFYDMAENVVFIPFFINTMIFFAHISFPLGSPGGHPQYIKVNISFVTHWCGGRHTPIPTTASQEF
jgi:hypothetical protein